MIPDWSERSACDAAYPNRHWMTDEPKGFCDTCGVEIRTSEELGRDLCDECFIEAMEELEVDK